MSCFHLQQPANLPLNCHVCNDNNALTVQGQLMLGISPLLASFLSPSKHPKASQTSACCTQSFRSNGTMLPTLTWATLLSGLKVITRFGGGVISAQMAICISGQHISIAGQMAQAALSAQAERCASTTPWPPLPHGLQPSGTTKQMQTWAHPTAQWRTAARK